MQASRRRLSISISLLFALGYVTLVLSALGNNPSYYFTDNINSSGTSPNITGMEQQLLDLINEADSTIELAIYDFNRDSIRDALIAAHQRGVSVRIVTDDEASEENATYKPYYDALKNAGITIVDDNRPADIMHNKFFVFDGEVVWTGSTNMSDNGFTKNHNNSIVFTSTVLANIYETEFDQMFAGSFSTAKTATAVTSITYNTIPLEIYFSPKDNAMDEVVNEVNAASESVYFSIFFFTDNNLRDAMINAHNRGVTVKGVWDLLGASNAYSDDEALCAAGITVKIEDFIGKMHNKFMVIDPSESDGRVITGSMNWTGAGGDDNDENTIILHDQPMAQAYKAAFDELFNALDDNTGCNINNPELDQIVYLPFVVKPGTPSANVRIASILYNPDGSDVDGEYVEIENQGNSAQDMNGWTLSDISSITFTFPDFTLDAGGRVYVWVKAGTNDSSNLFWGRGSSVWNNTGDTANLKDESGIMIDSCMYSGGEEGIVCP